jgi:HPr kinase/phosphorylase
MNTFIVHASCIVLGKAGLLIRGPSGSGKSDLVLRLIDSGDAQLVADDQVQLEFKQGGLYAYPPPCLAGKLEIRGQGIVELPYVSGVKITAVIDLVPLTDIERMPHPSDLRTTFEDVSLPCLKLFAPSSSALARIRAFLSLTLANSF